MIRPALNAQADVDEPVVERPGSRRDHSGLLWLVAGHESFEQKGNCMKFWERFFPGRRDALVHELAQRVAREQHLLVWQQLAARAGSLGSVPEARGYIRSRAQSVLRGGLTRVVDRSVELSPELRDSIVERAVEVLMGQFLTPMLSPVPVLAQVRRAA